MGLDMFLYGVKYHSEYDKNEDNDKSYYVMTEEIYWRKANQIHNWFVRECQDGVDNCAMYYVSKNDLKYLMEICKQVLEEKSLARLLLPTRSGFFFGSTEYDEFYYNDLKFTADEIERLLNEDKYEYYKYTSSW